MTRGRWSILIGGVIIFVAATSTLSIWIISEFASRTTREHSEVMGTIGDSFGAAAAIFAGLGFVGLVVALAFDVQERRRDLDDRTRARRPFLVPTVGDQDAKIDKAQRLRGVLEVEINVVVTVENFTDEPALNPALTAQLVTPKDDLSVSSNIVNVPIGPKKQIDEESARVTLTAKDSGAEELISQLRAGTTPLDLEISVTYSSLTEKKWRSAVVYRLSAISGDQAQYAGILEGGTEFEITPPGSALAPLGANPLYLKAVARPDSWSQSDG